jgi:hypothetical protein
LKASSGQRYKHHATSVAQRSRDGCSTRNISQIGLPSFARTVKRYGPQVRARPRPFNSCTRPPALSPPSRNKTPLDIPANRGLCAWPVVRHVAFTPIAINEQEIVLEARCRVSCPDFLGSIGLARLLSRHFDRNRRYLLDIHESKPPRLFGSIRCE